MRWRHGKANGGVRESLYRKRLNRAGEAYLRALLLYASGANSLVVLVPVQTRSEYYLAQEVLSGSALSLACNFQRVARPNHSTSLSPASRRSGNLLSADGCHSFVSGKQRVRFLQTHS